MAKRLIILGSTGSIGTRTLDVVRDYPGAFEVVALTTNCQTDLLASQVREFSPRAICVCSKAGEADGKKVADAAGSVFFAGEAGLTRLIEEYEADIVVVSTVGFVGLAPTLRAIERGMTIALANKEVLVTAGEVVMAASRDKGLPILPIDSEHNAIFQCLYGNEGNRVRRIVLTASGGPFRNRARAEMSTITRDEALKHPTWNMGPKITIDSSTLMNKGFEVIEGMHLFGIPIEQVEVVVHPQSTIHSMVEYVDGSIIAQLGVTDMYLPIQNVLFYPERVENRFPSLDFAQLGQLTFEKPDLEKFPCLRYAYESASRGGTYPTVLNAANEIAVERFLAGEIGYLKISELIDKSLQAHSSEAALSLDAIFEADAWTRRFARSLSA